MTAPTPRPTREQVDDALRRTDVVDQIMSGGSLASVLAAEVRALRAETDREIDSQATLREQVVA